MLLLVRVFLFNFICKKTTKSLQEIKNIRFFVETKTKSIMKSQALKRAWELFKKYQMTFSQALIEGWKFVKRAFLKIEFAKTSNEEITYRAKLVKRFNALKEVIYLPKNHNSEVTIIDLKLNGRYESWMG